MAKLADAQDLKSCDLIGRAGSIPALGTISFNELQQSEILGPVEIRTIVPKIVPANALSVALLASMALVLRDDAQQQKTVLLQVV